MSVRNINSGTYFADAFTESLNSNFDCDLNNIILRANELLMKRVQEESNVIERRQAIESRWSGVSKSIYFRASN